MDRIYYQILHQANETARLAGFLISNSDYNPKLDAAVKNDLKSIFQKVSQATWAIQDAIDKQNKL